MESKVYKARNGKWGIAFRETNRSNVFGFGKWKRYPATFATEAEARKAAGL